MKKKGEKKKRMSLSAWVSNVEPDTSEPDVKNEEYKYKVSVKQMISDGRAFLMRIGYVRPSKPLGSGTFGMVFLTRRKDADMKDIVAVKVFNMRDDEFIREVHIQHTLAKRLPCLLSATRFGMDKKSSLAFMEMPFAQGGSLASYLHSRLANPKFKLVAPTAVDANMNITTQEILFLVHNMLCGLVSLHSLGLVHADLKPDNILLLRPNADAVLADFGLVSVVKSVHRRIGHLTFTAPWRPIEALLFPMDPVQPSGDIWAFGMILFQMFLALCLHYGSWEFHPYDISEKSVADMEEYALNMAQWLGHFKTERKNVVPFTVSELRRIVKGKQKLKTLDNNNERMRVLYMLEPVYQFYEIPDNAPEWPQDVWPTVHFLMDMVSDCLHLCPNNRPSANFLMHKLTKFITTQGLEPKECIIQRQPRTFVPSEDDDEEESPLTPSEQKYFDAMMTYSGSQKDKEHQAQLTWIIHQARQRIAEWKVDPQNGLDATLIRVLTTMLYWGRSGHAYLWDVDSRFTTFLKQINLTELSDGRIKDMNTLTRALKPWLFRLERTKVDDTSNAYSLPTTRSRAASTFLAANS